MEIHIMILTNGVVHVTICDKMSHYARECYRRGVHFQRYRPNNSFSPNAYQLPGARGSPHIGALNLSMENEKVWVDLKGLIQYWKGDLWPIVCQDGSQGDVEIS